MPPPPTPSEIMRHHAGELKGPLLLRCIEWYTNDEVEIKINQARSSPISGSNFFSAVKRAVTNVALQEGTLPTVWKLQLDRRRLENMRARFGEGSRVVRHLERSVRGREGVPNGTLPSKPTLLQLEAARPENGQQRAKAVETREYWFKFAEAVEKRYSQQDVAEVYGMARTVAGEEIRKAKHFVKRFREVERTEQRGEVVPKVYDPPDALLPGQAIFTPTANNRDSNTVDEEPQTRDSAAAESTTTTTTSSLNHLTRSKKLKTHNPALLSPRVKRTLYNLHDTLRLSPHTLPPLTVLANKLDPPIPIADLSPLEQQAFSTCETEKTLSTFRAWCLAHEAQILQRFGAPRVAGCLALIVRAWMEGVEEREGRGEVRLGETFLQAVMGGLEGLEGVEGREEGVVGERERVVRDYGERVGEKGGEVEGKRKGGIGGIVKKKKGRGKGGR